MRKVLYDIEALAWIIGAIAGIGAAITVMVGFCLANIVIALYGLFIGGGIFIIAMLVGIIAVEADRFVK